jgi:hypothetical protein
LKFLPKPALFLLVGSSLQAASFFGEGFENVSNLPGWAIINNSTPGGQTPEGWFQGTNIFTAQSGSSNSYIQANFENAGDPGDISTWLLTPELLLLPNTILQFWTIGEDVSGFPDRLEVRLSTSGSSTNVGSSPFSVGDFGTLLLSINPDLADDGYPTTWTEYSHTFTEFSSPVSGRIGFRYFVPDRTVNASTIGLDSVAVVPEPATGILLALGAVILTSLQRRRGLWRDN